MKRLQFAGIAWAAVLLGGLVQAQEPAPSSAPEQVVVKGQRVRAPLPAKDRSVAASVVPEQRLRAAGMTAPEALRSEPGVTVVQTGAVGSLATVSIRGATSAQTPVYLGAIRLNDDVGGTADLSLVPLWLLQRVEVYRGNAPLEADRLGIGGAIFFEPRRPSKTEAGVGLLGGSFGTKAGWLYAGHGNERAAALVGARFEQADNDYSYRNDQGTRFDTADDRDARMTNANVQTFDLWSLATTELDSGTQIDLLVNGARREQGVPLSLVPTQAARATTGRALAGLSARMPCDDEQTCTTQASTAAISSHSGYDDPLGELALASSRVDVTGRRVEQALSWRLDLSDRVTVTPSVRGAIERLAMQPLGGDGIHARRAFSRAAIGAEWRASRLVTLRALGSGSCHGTSPPAGRFCNTFEPEGRLGIQVGQPRLYGLANVGRYGRVPTLGELYGLSGALRGNDQLVPEHGLTAEAGLRATVNGKGLFKGAYVDAFVFARQALDLISYRRSSLGYVRPYNTGEARVLGLEALTGVGFTSHLLAELSVTMLDPRDVSDTRTVENDILPYQSRLVLAPRIQAFTRELPSWMHEARAQVSYVYQSSRYADDAGLVLIPAQGSLDIQGELQFDKGHYVARLRLANVLNESRVDVIGYPLPGRAVYGALEARW